MTEPGGCLRVIVGGTKDGEAHTYVCSLSSAGAGAGEGTGIPAALGAALHQSGASGRPPRGASARGHRAGGRLLSLAGKVVDAMSIGDGDGIPLTIEHVGPDGSARSSRWHSAERSKRVSTTSPDTNPLDSSVVLAVDLGTGGPKTALVSLERRDHRLGTPPGRAQGGRRRHRHPATRRVVAGGHRWRRRVGPRPP